MLYHYKQSYNIMIEIELSKSTYTLYNLLFDVIIAHFYHHSHIYILLLWATVPTWWRELLVLILPRIMSIMTPVLVARSTFARIRAFLYLKHVACELLLFFIFFVNLLCYYVHVTRPLILALNVCILFCLRNCVTMTKLDYHVFLLNYTLNERWLGNYLD